MPPLEQMDRHEYVVCWPAAAKPDRHGQKGVGTPRELLAKWNDDPMDVQNPQGETIKIDVTLTLGEPVNLGDLVWYGRLDDWDPAAHDGYVFVVIGTPGGLDLKARFPVYGAHLQRYGKNLPAGTP